MNASVVFFEIGKCGDRTSLKHSPVSGRASRYFSEIIVRFFVNPSVGNFGISASVAIREGIHESQNASDAAFEK
jgi:hypothetical protein